MQNMSYSYGLRMTALQILSQSKQAVSNMLTYLYDEQPTEEDFITEIARVCGLNGLNPRP